MSQPEVWLRGPIPDIPALLQPVAHSLLQCREEVRRLVPPLDDRTLRARHGAASVAYHVVHAIGALDRLFSYARGEQLTPGQQRALAEEKHVEDSTVVGETLASAFDEAVERALTQLRATDERTLLEPREVGRARAPSTVIGLLFHAAEHTQRHVGQATTTAKMLTAEAR